MSVTSKAVWGRNGAKGRAGRRRHQGCSLLSRVAVTATRKKQTTVLACKKYIYRVVPHVRCVHVTGQIACCAELFQKKPDLTCLANTARQTLMIKHVHWSHPACHSLAALQETCKCSVQNSHLVLSSVSPFFNATAEGANLALANLTKCSALSALKKPGNKYVLRGSTRLS